MHISRCAYKQICLQKSVLTSRNVFRKRVGKISSTMTANRISKLEAMIETYDKLVFSICYRISGDYFAAEDLAQETFLSAYQKYDSFDSNNEKAWICRIATNKSIDYLRNAGRRIIPTEAPLLEADMRKEASAEEICMENEIKDKMWELCSKLRPPYDEIAAAYYLEELSPQEIAEKREENVKTIRTQIYRARDMLRNLYRKEEEL